MSGDSKNFIKFKDGSYVRADSIISIKPVSDECGDRMIVSYAVGNERNCLFISFNTHEECLKEVQNIINDITYKEEK